MHFLNVCFFKRTKPPKNYYLCSFSVDHFHYNMLKRYFDGDRDKFFTQYECEKTDLYENLKQLQEDLTTVPYQFAIALDMTPEEIKAAGKSFKLSEHILFAVNVGSIFFDFNKPLDPSLKITKKSLEAKLIRTESPRQKV